VPGKKIGLLLALLPLATFAENDEAILAEGARVFDEVAGVGCKTCHGDYAEGDLGVGPFIRGAPEGMIRASIDATGEMIVVKNVITEDEIKAVSAYLGHLGTLQVARTLAKRGRFVPAEFSTRPGTRVQVIVRNSGFSPYTFRSDNMGIDDMTIPARGSGNFEWPAPDTEGEYSIYCTDCKLKDQYFVLKVDAGAEEFKMVVPVSKLASEDSM
jgi:mono/diheme cytochrome c family protein